VTIPGLGSTAYNSTLEAVWPQSVGVGVRQELSPTRVFSADVIWYDWSSAFNDFTLTMVDSTTPGFPNIVEKFPLRWRDSISTRLGMEQKVWNDQTLRLGYVHHRIPVPDATLTPFIQATLEHAGSVGWGTYWNGWDVDLGYMYLWGSSREVAASSFIGGDFDNATHRAQVHAGFVSFMKPF
jgi:long-subunit fatty acid transport protein